MWLFKRKAEQPEEIVIGGSELKGELNVFSPTWIYVREYAEKEIDRLRESNDALTADQIKTASIRGQIKALKSLIQLPGEKRRGLIAPQDEE